jgi:hypothetical protein
MGQLCEKCKTLRPRVYVLASLKWIGFGSPTMAINNEGDYILDKPIRGRSGQMNTYRITIKKGDETREYDLESEVTYHALAHRLWDETLDHQPARAYIVNVGGKGRGYIPCYVIDDAVHSGPDDAGLWLEPENRVAVTDAPYPEREKRANEALARVLAQRTTPPGLCTYHVTIKRGNQVQECDMDTSEYYINVAKRLWRENFSHKPTWAETVSAHPPGGYYVPRHIINDAEERVEGDHVVWLPPENVVMVDGDPDPGRRGEIHDAMRRAGELRNTPSGVVTYHVTSKKDGETQEYDVESGKHPRDVSFQIWLDAFGSPPKSFPSFLNQGGKGFSHRANAQGNSVTVRRKKK